MHTATKPGKLTEQNCVTFFKLIKERSDLTLLPGYFSRNFLFNKLNPAQVFIISQMQDIGFILFQVLI